MIKYIITTKRKDKIVADFCSIYLNELNNRYLANHQILSEIRDINVYLQEINQLETSIIAQESKNVLNDIENLVSSCEFKWLKAFRLSKLHSPNKRGKAYLSWQYQINRKIY